MSTKTTIEWCDHTFNPWIGCTKISSGCAHCYAETLANRFYRGTWGPQGVRAPASEKAWDEIHRWHRAAERAGQPALVFSGSMCDIFERNNDDTVIAGRHRLFITIEQTPSLIWLLVTKRPENITSMVPGYLGSGILFGDQGNWLRFPRSNVMFLTSVEDQASADKRIIELLRVPAAMRGLSVEPLLNFVDLGLSSLVDDPDAYTGGTCRVADLLHWVIVGGESGQKSRPCRISWLDDVGRQAKASNVPLFTKQLGRMSYDGSDLLPLNLKHSKGGDTSEWPTFRWERKFPTSFRR